MLVLRKRGQSRRIAGRRRVMANVFEVLRKDHEEVKRVLSELETGLQRTASTDELRLQEKLVEYLVIEESKHEAVEEEYFWPTVREKLSNGDHLADHAIEQEQQGKFVLDDLIGLNADKPRFRELVTAFIHDGREHIAYEEEQVWPNLEKVLSRREANALGKKLRQAKKIAPTRPHPRTPPKPGILKTAGSAAAAVDKSRDVITGRGKD
jgi:hemerythrin-like domain-containing protein